MFCLNHGENLSAQGIASNYMPAYIYISGRSQSYEIDLNYSYILRKKFSIL